MSFVYILFIRRTTRFAGPSFSGAQVSPDRGVTARENQEGETVRCWNIRESERSATRVTITLLVCVLERTRPKPKKKVVGSGVVVLLRSRPTKGSDSRSMAMSHSVGKVSGYRAVFDYRYVNIFLGLTRWLPGISVCDLFVIECRSYK